MKDRVEIAKPASKFCKTRLPQKMEADGAAIQGGRKTGQARPCVQKKHYRKCIGAIRRKSTQSGQMTGDVSAGTTGGVSAGTTGKV